MTTGLMKPVLTKHMESLQRVFKDRHLTVGASEIGRCARMTWYAKHHPSAKAIEAEESFGASHRGNMIEAHTVVPALRRYYGANILYSGKDQKTFVSGLNSATPDGLLINQPKDLLAEFGIKDIGKGRCILIEIKSIDPRIVLRVPKPEHARQANQQLGIVRSKGEWMPEHCLVMYVNASFMDDVTEFVVTFDPELYKRQQARAKMILGAKTAREMQPEGWIKGGKECDYCHFAKACIELRTDLPPEGAGKVDPQFVAELKELAFAERDLATTISALEENQREMQVQIKDRLRAKKLRGIKEPDITVSWYPIKPRVTLDMDSLRAAAEAAKFNLAPHEKTGDGGDGLRITVKSLNAPKMKGEAPKAKLTGGLAAPSGKAKSKAKA
jgi:hypothetical protein